MRRSGAEKREMIRLVEPSDLPARATLRQLGIAPSTFYGWYQRYLDGGPEALEDRKPRPRARWNKISPEIRQEVVDLALEKTELSARELACHFTDERRYFLSESSVYRILKAYDLITSPAYVLLSASDRFAQPSARALADRLHLPAGDRLGLVLPFDRDGRLLALSHRLEAQPDDGCGRCDGDAG